MKIQNIEGTRTIKHPPMTEGGMEWSFPESPDKLGVVRWQRQKRGYSQAFCKQKIMNPNVGY